MRHKAVVLMYVVLVVGFITTVAIEVAHPSALIGFCDEDGPAESMEAIAYLTSSVFFLMFFKKSHYRNLALLLLGAMFFGLFGEEISWGQRIFSIKTPADLEAINVQRELNFHNIAGIHEHIRAVALLVIFTICFFIPVLHKFSQKFRDFTQKYDLPVFPFYAVGLPLIAILYMVIPRAFNVGSLFDLDELGELVLSLGFLLFAVQEFLHRRKTAAV